MAFSALTGPIAHTVGSAAQTLAEASVSVPDNAAYAEGYVRTASVVVSKTSTDPTATLGTQYDPTDIIYLRSRDEILSANFIRQASTDATINWDFFNEAPRAE